MILYRKKNSQDDIEIWIKKDKGGSLHIEGQDLSDSVSEMFGENISEYEWSYIIQRKDFQNLINAIGKQESNDIQHQFWNRMGD